MNDHEITEKHRADYANYDRDAAAHGQRVADYNAGFAAGWRARHELAGEGEACDAGEPEAAEPLFTGVVPAVSAETGGPLDGTYTVGPSDCCGFACHGGTAVVSPL